MADPPPPGLPPTPAAPDTWQPTPLTDPRGPSRWSTVAALGIALAALVIAIAGWFRPPPAAEPVFSEQQIADAKTRACEAFELVVRGLVLQTRSEESDDSAKIDARAANARLAIVAGARYLQDHVDLASPPALSLEIQHLATVMLDLAANYLAGARDADPPQADRLAEGESLIARVQELCK